MLKSKPKTLCSCWNCLIYGFKTEEKHKAFVESQFGYCPLIWVFHSRGRNKKLNGIHERALRIPYKDKSSAFQELLEKDCSVSIHYKNIQKLAVEDLKDLSPPILMRFCTLVMPI